MSEEDFACDKFVAQKRRGDVCRKCYQPFRLHTKRQLKAETGSKGDAGSKGEAPKSTPKVLERFRRKKRDSKVEMKEEVKAGSPERVNEGQKSPERTGLENGGQTQPVEKSRVLDKSSISSPLPSNSTASSEPAGTQEGNNPPSDTPARPHPSQPADKSTKSSPIPSKPPPPKTSVSNRPSRPPPAPPTSPSKVPPSPSEAPPSPSEPTPSLSEPTPSLSEPTPTSPTKPTPNSPSKAVPSSPVKAPPNKPPPPPRTTSIGTLQKPQPVPEATPPQQVPSPPQQTEPAPQPTPSSPQQSVEARSDVQTTEEEPEADVQVTEREPEASGEPNDVQTTEKEPEADVQTTEREPNANVQVTEEEPEVKVPEADLQEPEAEEQAAKEVPNTDVPVAEEEPRQVIEKEPEASEPAGLTEPHTTRTEEPTQAPEGEPEAVQIEGSEQAKEEVSSPQTPTQEDISNTSKPVVQEARPTPRPPPPPRTSSISTLSQPVKEPPSPSVLQPVEDSVGEEGERGKEEGGEERGDEVEEGEREGGGEERGDEVKEGEEGQIEERGEEQEEKVEGMLLSGEGGAMENIAAGVSEEDEEWVMVTEEEAESAIFAAEADDEEVRSKYPTEAPRDLTTPTYTEDDLPPPHVLTDEVSPPPQLIGEVSPPPLFAEEATPTQDQAPVTPPPPPVQQGNVPIAPPPPPIAAPTPLYAPPAAARPPPASSDDAPPPSQGAAAPPPSRGTAPSLRVPSPDSAMAQAMESIRSGGVALRRVPPPVQRAAGEHKVVDVASELRAKMMKQRKQENQGVSERLEQNREEARKLGGLLVECSGTHSFTRQLRALLHRVDQFLEHVGLSQEVLSQNVRWPVRLVQDLREVVEHMRLLDERVKAAELLCQQTLQGAEDVSATVHINPDAVDKCITNMVTLARKLVTEESRYVMAAQNFPVDESDLQSFIQRGAVAVTPLMDLLYKKAFSTYDSISEPSITNFDKRFRVQNALRLLKMCCNLSDAMSMHLNVPRHVEFSQAKLKQVELKDCFTATTRVATREGEWDTEEQVKLGQVVNKSPQKQGAELVDRVITSLGEEGKGVEDLWEELSAELGAELSVENYAKIEWELLKAALASGKEKVIDGAIALTKKVYAGDEAATHQYDYDWLLDPVVKGNHERIQALVREGGLHINSRSRDVGNSVLHRAVNRKDLATAACLVRLGADPLLKNTHQQSPVQLLALKCFPPSHFPANITGNEPPMSNLASYIDNPSLSDVVLVSEEGRKFFAHRLILCVQSPVLKTMLDSDLWEESHNKEIPLPTVTERVLQHLLRYLYTGECLFPRDDLNLGLDLMGVADQFFLQPMKSQCEKALSEKIDTEVVVPMYYAAFRYNSSQLLANCAHYLLHHYQELADQETLLHLLENSVLDPASL